MDALPSELLSMVIEELWKDPPNLGPRLTHKKLRSKPKDRLLLDLRNVRLVCKGFRDAAADLWGSSFFEVRWVCLTRKGLEELITISRLPQYARYINTVRITAMKFDKQLHDDGQMVPLLAEGLSNLKTTLTSILLSLKYRKKNLRYGEEADILGIVESALSRSDAHPSRLRIYTNKPQVLALPEFGITTTSGTAMQHIKCLKLDFLNETTVDASTYHALSSGTVARFLDHHQQQLEKLSIYFAREIWYRAPLSRLIGSASLTKLTFLRLHGFNCRESELTRFLLQHCDTLEYLEVADFKLRKGRWRCVFETISEDTRIEKLLFRRVWDKVEVFSHSDNSFQGCSRQEIETLDWSKIGVPREESDLDLEPVELGETGMFIDFPQDLIYDADNASSDDDEVVNPLPYFANELLHPGLPGVGSVEDLVTTESSVTSTSADSGMSGESRDA